MAGNDATIKDFVTPKTHRFRIKVYRIKITDSKTGSIWYASKKGMEYYAVLATKETLQGGTPVFRLVEVNEAKTYLKPCVIYKDVYPGDCTIIDEFIVRSTHSLNRLYK